jgi:hypothetical protein
MNCALCETEIPVDEQQEYLGRTLCEDCYIDALSPLKTCDPWAVHCAKSFEKCGVSMGVLTPLQSEILAVLKKTDGVERQSFLEQLDKKISLKELEREFATLRHMEKARAEKRGDKVFWRLW